MDTLTAFMLGEANRGREMKVFDWDKAARIIWDHNAKSADAGLIEDWEWTGGSILSDGAPVPEEETYTYLASTWATPVLIIDGEEIECYRMESKTPGWGSGTYWPASALKILRDGEST